MQSNNFTIFRLLLASLVVFGHFKTIPGLPFPFGIHSYADFAVDAFFIVSGFLVYGSYENHPKLKGFYIKRFFRIYPLYMLMILLQAIVMLVLLGGSAGLYDILKYLGSNLVFANFLSPDMGGLLKDANNPAINPSLWTLKIEVAFYLMVPLIWVLVKKLGIKLLAVIYILSTVFAAVTLYYGLETLYKQLPGQLRFFVVGILLYHYQHKLKISPLLAFALAIPLIALCSLRFELSWLLPVYPLLVGALVFICVLRLPVIKIKYDISYGVYLIHAPLIQLSLLTGFFIDSGLFLLILLAMVYVLAFCAEKFVELPMVRLGKKYAKQ